MRRPSHADSALDELADGPHHSFLLSGRELAVDRQREAAGGGPLGFRKLSAAMTKLGETGLQMERDGIVDLRADAAFLEMRSEPVAVRGANDELVIDVPAIGRLRRQRDVFEKASLAEQRSIVGGVGAAALGPAVDIRRLD